MSRIHQIAFHALCALGAPIGGVRPRRIYHWLARRGFDSAEGGRPKLRWYRDRWGYSFELSPFYHIDRSIIAFGAYELSLLKFLRPRLRPGMICFDVGANLGQVAVHMADLVKPEGRVHAFEPVPPVVERLEANLARNGLRDVVELHRVALAEAEGTAKLRYADPGVDNQGMGSLVVHDHPLLARSLDVATMRLDDFVRRHAVPRIDWIKIDIQGAEPLLLSGARETLARFSPRMLVEVAPRDLRAGGETSRGLLELLESLDYRVYEFRGSRITRRVEARAVPPDYDGNNVYCTKQREGPES